jgi:hypothetical protein
MSDRAYLRVWCREASATAIADLLRGFLETVPYSRARTGCTRIAVRAVNSSEAPILERDLRSAPAMPPEVLEEVGGLLELDSSVELEAWWDLWVFDTSAGAWKEQPQRLELVFNGPEFDEGAWRDAGHLCADLGFEHLFTGHGGLPGDDGIHSTVPRDPTDAEFLSRMARPEARTEYAARTRENIRRLRVWVDRVAKALPVERFVLESEGEVDFEAKLELVAGDQ